MPRPYPPELKEKVLEHFIAYQGDIMRTCREFGISDRTLYRWSKRAGVVISPTPPTPPTYDSNGLDTVGTGRALSAESQGANALPPDDLQALRELKAQMLELARYIMLDERIKRAIDAAPLNQRIAAATQLIDRIIKLGAQLPADEEDEEIITYERGETDEEDDTAGETAQETTDYFG
ncbi:MAG: transposase [Chloroflexota bacterium]